MESFLRYYIVFPYTPYTVFLTANPYVTQFMNQYYYIVINWTPYLGFFFLMIILKLSVS